MYVVLSEFAYSFIFEHLFLSLKQRLYIYYLPYKTVRFSIYKAHIAYIHYFFKNPSNKQYYIGVSKNHLTGLKGMTFDHDSPFLLPSFFYGEREKGEKITKVMPFSLVKSIALFVVTIEWIKNYY